jgi:NCAIR mutase (PurE)-related protein
LAVVAARQYGVVSRSQVLAAGVGVSGIDNGFVPSAFAAFIAAYTPSAIVS